MKRKDALIALIDNGGHCEAVDGLDCKGCPLSEKCEGMEIYFDEEIYKDAKEALDKER